MELEQLEYVLRDNCQKMAKGIRGTGCVVTILNLTYKLYKKNELGNALPLLEKYLKTANYDDFNQIHPHLLRAVVLNLETYVQKYNIPFLKKLFIMMEEQAITGVYFLTPNGKFADNKLMAKMQTYGMNRNDSKGLSNTAIVIMLQKMEKTTPKRRNTKTTTTRTRTTLGNKTMKRTRRTKTKNNF